MRTEMECWECFSSTFGGVAIKLSKDTEQAHEIVTRLCKETAKDFETVPPAHIGTRLNKIIMEYFDHPFQKEKDESTELGLKVFEGLKDQPLSLEMALKIALFGNIMDYSVKGWDPKNIDINTILDANMGIDHSEHLDSELKKAKTVLYLTDNAGEVILDYFLIKYIKRLGAKVILAPKAGPIQNDATIEDLKEAPLMDIVDEIIPAAQAVGLEYESCSTEFKEVFETADVLIFKGMGYFENSFDYDKNAFFILKAKCEPVARVLGVNKGDNIVCSKKKYNENK